MICSSARIDNCETFVNEIQKQVKDIDHKWLRDGIRMYLGKIKGELSELRAELPEGGGMKDGG